MKQSFEITQVNEPLAIAIRAITAADTNRSVDRLGTVEPFTAVEPSWP